MISSIRDTINVLKNTGTKECIEAADYLNSRVIYTLDPIDMVAIAESYGVCLDDEELDHATKNMQAVGSFNGIGTAIEEKFIESLCEIVDWRSYPLLSVWLDKKRGPVGQTRAPGFQSNQKRFAQVDYHKWITTSEFHTSSALRGTLYHRLNLLGGTQTGLQQ